MPVAWTHVSAASIAPPWEPAWLPEKMSLFTLRVPLPRSSTAPPESVPLEALPPLMVIPSMLMAPTLVAGMVMLLPVPPLSRVGRGGPVPSMLSESPSLEVRLTVTDSS